MSSKLTLASLAQYERNVIKALFIHNLSFIYARCLCKQNRTKNETLKNSKCWILLTNYSNQSGWGMPASLKGYKSEHTVLSIHFKSFNDDCAIDKQVQDTYSQ